MDKSKYQSNPELLERLEAFDIDGGRVSFSFAERLARDSGWSVEYARRVVAEYKRFLYLAMTAGHPVTPSDEVDQAWHLHMVYTESYWIDLCGTVLQKPLHHGPTKGGSDERAKYTDLYGMTLESYRFAFGTEPPADVWPASKVRFRRATQFKRVNVAENWVIRKPWHTSGAQSVVAVGSFVALILLGAAATLGSKPMKLSDVPTSTLIWIGVGVVALLIFIGIMSLFGNRKGNSGCSSGDSSGCSSGCSSGDSGCSSGCSGCGGGGD